jgi:hypothetical protein
MTTTLQASNFLIGPALIAFAGASFAEDLPVSPAQLQICSTAVTVYSAEAENAGLKKRSDELMNESTRLMRSALKARMKQGQTLDEAVANTKAESMKHVIVLKQDSSLVREVITECVAQGIAKQKIFPELSLVPAVAKR